jgi:hypothetical protein
MGEACGGLTGNLPGKLLHGGTCEISPPAFATPWLHALSRVLFVFYFERDLHGLFLCLFQKAKLLQMLQLMELGGKCVDGFDHL